MIGYVAVPEGLASRDPTKSGSLNMARGSQPLGFCLRSSVPSLSMDPEWARTRGLEPDTIGWCHHCETFQRYKHARRTETRRGLCVSSECDETWAFGIWDMTTQPDFANSPCWATHADRNDSLYPGSCTCSSEQA
jgi:hypothetical protein